MSVLVSSSLYMIVQLTFEHPLKYIACGLLGLPSAYLFVQYFLFGIWSDIFRSFLVVAQKASIIGCLPNASLSDRKRISVAQLSSSRHNISLLRSV